MQPWKTTSIFINGRRPFLVKGRRPNIFENGRQPKNKMIQPKTIKSKNNNIFENGRQPIFLLKKEDDLIFFKYGRLTKKHNKT
jgi:hypothetical protein